MAAQRVQLAACLLQRVDPTGDDRPNVAGIRQLGDLPQCSVASPGDNNRRHTLQWWWCHLGVLHGEVASPKAEWRRSPDSTNDRNCLSESLLPLPRRRVGQPYAVELVGSP